jgi:1-acyl-sn-glycerol-3-phosphate acyltransferase
MLFSIIAWTGGVVNTIFWGTLSLIFSLFDSSGKLQHLCSRWWSRINLKISGTRVEVGGLENVIKDGPQIFASNHQSIYDILMLAGYLPMQFRWLAKRELFNIPFMGWHMSRMGYIKIDRSNMRQAALSFRKAAEKIKNGVSVVIFPEGTRSTDGKLQPFKSGLFSLAIHSGVPIIPVSINGSKDIIKKGSLRVNRGKITMLIGKPIDVSKYQKGDKTKLMREVGKAISLNLKT